MQFAAEDWNQILEAYTHRRAMGPNDEEEQRTVIGSLPWRRIYIQYKVKKLKGELIPDPACRPSDSDYQNLLNEYNLLKNHDSLRFIRQLENWLVRFPPFSKLCFRSLNKNGMRKPYDEKPTCAPLASIAGYFYPGKIQQEIDGHYFWSFQPAYDFGPFDPEEGANAQQGPPDDILRAFYQNPSWRWFTDSSNSKETQRSLMLRTQMMLGRPLDGISEKIEAEKLMKTFIKQLTGHLDRVISDGSLTMLDGSPVPEGVEVTYGGDGIIESVLDDAKERDQLFVLLGIVIVHIFLGVYTHSVFIAFMCFIQYGITYCTSAFLHFSTSDIEQLSLLSLLSSYVLLGMSTDGVMVFFNTFRQSAFMETNGRRNTLNVPQRLAFCFRKAGVGITISHLTAGVAFSMNSLSPVPAIRDFGVFMFIIMLVNIYMFLTVFPCILILHHYHVSHRRRNAQRQKELMLSLATLKHPVVLRNALRQVDSKSRMQNNVPPVYTVSSPRAVQEQPEAAENKTKVQFGEGTGKFSRLQARLRPLVGSKKPKTEEEARAEQQEAFDQFSGNTLPQRSRRKQASSSVLQLPFEYTTLCSSSSQKTVAAPPQVYDPPLSFNLDLSTYCDNVRSKWETRSKDLNIATHLGVGIFVDPSTGRRLDCTKKIPTITQVMSESNTALRIVNAGIDFEEGEREINAEGGAEQPSDANTSAAQQNNAAETGVPQSGPVVMGSGGIDGGQVVQITQPPPGSGPIGGGIAPVEERPNYDNLNYFSRAIYTIRDWWVARGKVKRRFGRFGKRVGETRAEKDRRIMSKRAKHEGYNPLERFFYNTYTPMLATCYPVILTLYFTKMLIFIIVFLSHLDPLSEPPRLLDFQANYERFEEVQKEFPVQGTCDYCGPYFQPRADFPPPFGGLEGTTDVKDYEDWEKCNHQMYNHTDECGTCGGDSQCVDCMGQPWLCRKHKTIDSCESMHDGVFDCIWQPSWGKDGPACIDKPLLCPNAGGQVTRTYQAGWVFDECGVCYLPSAGNGNEDVMVPARTSDTECSDVISQRPNRCNDVSAICEVRKKTDECTTCMMMYEKAGWQDVSPWINTFPAPRSVDQIAQAGNPYCTTKCDSTTCNPERGVCDVASGKCICHSDYVKGFFKGDSCDECEDGFFDYGGKRCTAECIEDDPDADDCDCQCLEIRSPTPIVGTCMCTTCTRNISNETFTIPRPMDSDEWSEDIVAVGHKCNTRQRSRARFATMNNMTGARECDPAYDADPTCSLAIVCNGHGILNPYGECTCYGCWSGEFCDESKCKNSGSCTMAGSPLEWECSCRGVWEGEDCSQCPVTCQEHSHCPIPHIKITDYRNTECWSGNGKNCFGHWTGDLENNKCDVCKSPDGVPEWKRNETDQMCTPDGKIIGCDGLDATDTHYKWIDGCDVCGNEGTPPNPDETCSCDGSSHHWKQINSCGICGEATDDICTCSGTVDPESIPEKVELFWGLIPDNFAAIDDRVWEYDSGEMTMEASPAVLLDPNMNFEGMQRLLYSIFERYLPGKVMGRHVNFQQSEIMIFAWKEFLQTHVIVFEDSTRERPLEVRKCKTVVDTCKQDYIAERKHPDEVLDYLYYPMSGKHTEWVLYQFMTEQRVSHLLGFSTSNSSSPDLKLNWIRFRIELSGLTKKATKAERRAQYDVWEHEVFQINEAAQEQHIPLPLVRHWSDAWVKLFTEEQSENGTMYALGMGGTAIAVITLLYSCSITLMLLSSLSVAGVVVFTMSYMRIAGWELGPAEQTGLTCLVGLACEYTIHLLGGYIEYIHATQSSLLARDTTRAQAIAGTLQRTGVPITVSAAAVLVASHLLLFCDILIYRRIAEIIIMVTLISAAHGLLFFPCLILVCGPVTILRNWTARLLFLTCVVFCTFFTIAIIYLSGSAKGPDGEDLFDF
eukprot:TRINITY_DN4791_c9_g1_i1.p1 TRINITY_DN4791_c9_g1~~TRINITY_DN4791_c9_g1_i1.p1  ORF type:complete len:2034 (+),score=337.76 TRINITY_DN4791_c9_g1_i1:379-6102(+)